MTMAGKKYHKRENEVFKLYIYIKYHLPINNGPAKNENGTYWTS